MLPVVGVSLAANGAAKFYFFSSFPTRHLAPFCNTYLAIRMLLQAYEPDLESMAFIIEQFEKNRALNTL